jgi:2-iminobutanoate/2-iminopropanoate deaminase
MSEQKIINTTQAPAAIGPYSQAISVDGWIYGSGQIALDPVSGEMVGNGDIAAETEQVFNNIEAVLAAGGAELSDIVKCTVYLIDLGQFVEMNTIYEKRFGNHKPARATVQVSRLPKDATVEIDFVVNKSR